MYLYACRNSMKICKKFSGKIKKKIICCVLVRIILFDLLLRMYMCIHAYKYFDRNIKECQSIIS